MLFRSDSYNRLNWYEYNDGVYPGAENWSGAYPSNYTFTAKGDSIKFVLYFNNPVDDSAMDNMVIKLEKGINATPHHEMFQHYDRKISHHETSLKGSVDMVINPFHFDASTLSGAHTINTYLANINTESLNSNGEFTLSKGVWHIDLSLRIERMKESSGFYTLVVYRNGVVSKRALKSANTYDSVTLSTTLFCDEGDTVKFGIFAFYMSVGEMTDGFDITDSQGANYLTMKKIGGL